MRAFLSVLLVCAVQSASVPQSRLSVFVTEDAPVPNPTEVLNRPMFVVSKSLAHPGYYKPAVLIAGLEGADVKLDPRFREVRDFLHSSSNKYALFTDARKFYNSEFFDTPLRAGDQIVVPSQFMIETYRLNTLPVLIIADQADFKRYNFKNLKQVAKFGIYPDAIKPLK
ncbi:hypothetical protein J6590_061354 [Homalodisca vitripennis]|nr:hypothetical protein J6590_061354 [Homalodisca vitripennis]